MVTVCYPGLRRVRWSCGSPPSWSSVRAQGGTAPVCSAIYLAFVLLYVYTCNRLCFSYVPAVDSFLCHIKTEHIICAWNVTLSCTLCVRRRALFQCEFHM